MQATTPTGWRTPDRAHEPAGRERGGRHLAGRERDRRRLERALGVAPEAVDARRHLHRRSRPSGSRRSPPAPAGRARRRARAAVGGRAAAARPAPRASCATTRGSAARGRGRGRLGAARPTPRAPADDLLGGRVDDVVGAAAAVDPLAADEQPVRPSRFLTRCQRTVTRSRQGCASASSVLDHAIRPARAAVSPTTHAELYAGLPRAVRRGQTRTASTSSSSPSTTESMTAGCPRPSPWLRLARAHANDARLLSASSSRCTTRSVSPNRSR